MENNLHKAYISLTARQNEMAVYFVRIYDLLFFFVPFNFWCSTSFQAKMYLASLLSVAELIM